jgi:predicted GNAT family acetyltransferase
MSTSAEPSVTRSDERRRWELTIDGEVVAFADFVGDDPVTIPYIETALEHRGNGYSAMLMDGVIEELRTRAAVVRATCPVARAHLAAHAPELLSR